MNTPMLLTLILISLLAGAAMVLLPYAAKHPPAPPPTAARRPGRRRIRLQRAWAAFRRWWHVRHRLPELGGYVHDTHMSQFLPFSLFSHSAGTWTATVASNLWFVRRSAADAASTTRIPVLLPSNGSGSKGAYLTRVDIFYRVSTAALDALSADLYKLTVAADGAVPTVAAVPAAYDSGHDAAEERVDADEHVLSLSLTTPAWVDTDEAYFVEVVADNAATSVLDFFGARAHYTLRL